MNIVMLTGPDRVRKRPAVIFLSNGIEGAQYAVQSLLKIFVTEAQLGHCKQLKVKQAGESLEISGDDRGIYLGQDTGDDAVWQSIFCELFAAPAYPQEDWVDPMDAVDNAHYVLYGDKADTTDGLYYLELYAAQCVCKHMELQVNRSGIESTLRFEKGINIGGICNKPTTAQNGTCFRFALDPEVFTQTLIPESFFLEKLETFSILVPGLTCIYENADGVETVFCCPEGAKDYIERKNPGSVYHTKMWAKGRERYNSAEYKAHLEVSLGYTPNAGEVRCFHNLNEMPGGGAHLKELQKRLRKAFYSCYGINISVKELSEHMTIILSTRCAPLFTAWRNGTRQAVDNRLMADMAQDAIDEAFNRYLFEFKEVYRGLVDAVIAKRETK